MRCQCETTQRKLYSTNSRLVSRWVIVTRVGLIVTRVGLIVTYVGSARLFRYQYLSSWGL